MELVLEQVLVGQKSSQSFQQDVIFELQEMKKQQKMFETQLAQQALNAPRPSGQLPGQLEINSKEQCRAVTLRSGKELEEFPPMRKGATEEKIEKPSEEEESKYIAPPPYKPPLPFLQRKVQVVQEQ